jgi:hypothetical protein
MNTWHLQSSPLEWGGEAWSRPELASGSKTHCASKSCPLATSTELCCHAASSTQTHLTWVRPRELLCFAFSMLRSWDPTVVETWMEMLKEKLKLTLT